MILHIRSLLLWANSVLSWELQQTKRTVDSICLFATEQTKTQRVAQLLISVPLMVRGDLDTKEGPMLIPPQFKGHIVHILWFTGFGVKGLCHGAEANRPHWHIRNYCSCRVDKLFNLAAHSLSGEMWNEITSLPPHADKTRVLTEVHRTGRGTVLVC